MITISVFLICAVVCGLLTRQVREFAIARNLVVGPGSSRHVHSRPIPRLGGVAIFVTTAGILPLSVELGQALGLRHPVTTNYLFGFLAPASIVFLLGLLDDLRGVSARVKFGVQATAAMLLWLEGIRVTRLPFLFGDSTLHTILSLAATVLWVVWITNAFNLIDGLDGLAAGSALFSTLVICVFSLVTGNGPVAFITIGLAGAIAGFLRYNFNPASIFLGDCGSLFIGFLLGGIAIRGSQKVPTLVAVAIPVVSLGLPILDVSVAVARRFLSGKPLFSPDREHIHHKLLGRGLTHKQTVLVLYCVSAVFGVLSLVLLTPGGKLSGLILVVVGLIVFFGLQQLRYREMDELGRVVNRTVAQRTIIANNLAIRRAAETLPSCTSLESISAVLEGVLQPIGFCGFTLQLANAGMSSRAFSQGHDFIETFWNCPSPKRDPAWTLAIRIEHGGQQQAMLMLHRITANVPLRMDVNLFTTSEFHRALGESIAFIVAADDFSGDLAVGQSASAASAD